MSRGANAIVDIDICTTTALFLACRHSQSEIVKWLVENGALHNYDRNGSSELMEDINEFFTF